MHRILMPNVGTVFVPELKVKLVEEIKMDHDL
jgi:hypothetical protein